MLLTTRPNSVRLTYLLTYLLNIAMEWACPGSRDLILLAGLLCEYGFDGGCPSVFYVFGLYSFRRHVSWTVIASQLPLPRL